MSINLVTTSEMLQMAIMHTSCPLEMAFVNPFGFIYLQRYVTMTYVEPSINPVSPKKLQISMNVITEVEPSVSKKTRFGDDWRNNLLTLYISNHTKR
jgi:hypothetical protein